MSLIVLFFRIKKKDYECIIWVEEIEKQEINFRRQHQK